MSHTSTPQWRKSSHSTAGNDCVEVAQTGTTCAVRDSKNPANGHLTFAPTAWEDFTSAIKHGRHSGHPDE